MHYTCFLTVLTRHTKIPEKKLQSIRNRTQCSDSNPTCSEGRNINSIESEKCDVM